MSFHFMFTPRNLCVGIFWTRTRSESLSCEDVIGEWWWTVHLCPFPSLALLIQFKTKRKSADIAVRIT